MRLKMKLINNLKSINIVWFSLGVVLTILLGIFIASPTAQQAIPFVSADNQHPAFLKDVSSPLTANDYFIKIIETKADLTYAYTIFEFNNPTDKPINTNKLNNEFKHALRKARYDLTSTEYYYLNNESYEVPTYKTTLIKKTCTTNSTLLNESNSTNTTYDCSYTTQTQNGTITRYRQRWIPLKELHKFEPNTKYTLKAYATFPAQLGPRAIDWIPTLETNSKLLKREKWTWWNSSWSHRMNITIDHTKVTADQTDFPVYINASMFSSTVWSHLKSDCSDIRFTKSDQTTQLPVEIVTCDSNNKDAEIWVRANLSGSTDTILTMYYGNAGASMPSASSTYGSENVWKTNYKAVYHLPDGSTLSAVDSTSNNNDGTNHGATATTGQIDGSSSYSSDYIDMGNDASLKITGDLSVQVWVYPTGFSGFPRIVEMGGYHDNSGGYNIITHDSTGTVNWAIWSPTEYRVLSTNPISTNTWTAITGTYDGNYVKLYINGAYDKQESAGTTGTPTHNFYLGQHFAGSDYWAGKIDEVRILNTELSSTWISTEYNNQHNSTTFYSIGSEESPIIYCTFQGYVFDENSNPLQNANVTIFNQEETSEIYSNTTDSNGFWSIQIPNSTNTYVAGAYYNNTLLGSLKPFISGTC